MSDTVLRDEVVREIERSIRVRVKEINAIQTAMVDDLSLAAARILAIPAIKEALAFHEACQKAFAVNGEFTVTKENIRGKGGVSAN